MHIDTKPVVELKTAAAQLPPDLDVDCDDPTKISGTSAGHVERDWGKDRAALVNCKALHKKTRAFYKERDAKLSAEKH